MKMIKLSDTHYIVVDDSEIKEGDKPCYCYNSIKATWDDDIIFYQGTMPMYHYKGFKKITHSTEPLEPNRTFRKIKSLSLSEVEEAINGYNTYDLLNKVDSSCEKGKYEHWLFKQGFKAHQELVKDRLFTMNDLKTQLVQFVNDFCHFKYKGNYADIINQFCNNAEKSLLPKTEWEVEFDEQGKLKLVKDPPG